MLLKNYRCNEKNMSNMNMENMNMDMPMNMGMDMGMGCNMMNGACQPSCVCPPVYECPQERVCHRHSVIEVPHIIPINTRIINHQIIRHTYMPCYTSCEQTEVSNVYENNCGF